MVELVATLLDMPSDERRTEGVQAIRALARISRALERSSAELNLAHYRVLSAVADGDERASRVAGRLALGKPAVSAAVDALCQQGLLLRVGVERDRRAAALALTPAGEAALTAVEREMLSRIEGLCARTPDGPRVLESLAWLGDALDEAAAERRAAERSRRGTG